MATGSGLLLRSDSGSDGDSITELIPLPAGEPATQPCQSDSSTSSFGKPSYSGGIFELRIHQHKGSR